MYSIDYLKQRFNDPENVNFSAEDLEGDIEIINPIEFCKKEHITLFDNIPDLTFENGTTESRTVEYTPDADFDFYTTDECTHDGTLLFKYERVRHSLGRLDYTFRSPDPLAPLPAKNIKTKYFIGDVVVVTKYDENRWATAEKPFLKYRTSVFIPIRTEVSKAES